jgi:hypothetical protein
MVPVPKSVRTVAGEVYLVASTLKKGFARFVSAFSGCRHALLKLVKADDGSGLQRWSPR